MNQRGKNRKQKGESRDEPAEQEQKIESRKQK
jgi:hypothetical protein